MSNNVQESNTKNPEKHCSEFSPFWNWHTEIWEFSAKKINISAITHYQSLEGSRCGLESQVHCTTQLKYLMQCAVLGTPDSRL